MSFVGRCLGAIRWVFASETLGAEPEVGESGSGAHSPGEPPASGLLWILRPDRLEPLRPGEEEFHLGRPLGLLRWILSPDPLDPAAPRPGGDPQTSQEA